MYYDYYLSVFIFRLQSSVSNYGTDLNGYIPRFSFQSLPSSIYEQ